jgi:hypothetical protein
LFEIQNHITVRHLKIKGTTILSVVKIKDEPEAQARLVNQSSSVLDFDIPTSEPGRLSVSDRDSIISNGRSSRMSCVSQFEEDSRTSISRKRLLSHQQEVEGLENEVKRLKLTNRTILALAERNDVLVDQLRLATESRSVVEAERNSLKVLLLNYETKSRRDDDELSRTNTTLFEVKRDLNDQLFAGRGREEQLKEENKTLKENIEALRESTISPAQSQTIEVIANLKNEIDRLNDIIRLKTSKISENQIVEERITLENRKLKQMLNSNEQKLKDQVTKMGQAEQHLEEMQKIVKTEIEELISKVSHLTKDNEILATKLKSSQSEKFEPLKQILCKVLERDDSLCNGWTEIKKSGASMNDNDVLKIVTEMIEGYFDAKEIHLSDVKQLNERIHELRSSKVECKSKMANIVSNSSKSLHKAVNKLKEESEKLKNVKQLNRCQVLKNFLFSTNKAHSKLKCSSGADLLSCLFGHDLGPLCYMHKYKTSLKNLPMKSTLA